MPTLTREMVQSRLAVNRVLLDALAPTASTLAAQQVTPEWNALDVLRHVWVWDELTSRCLADWLGDRGWLPAFADEDHFNIKMVAARQASRFEQIHAGMTAAYQVYEQQLALCSDEELAQRARTPWGADDERLTAIWEILGHGQEHLSQLRVGGL